MMSASQPGAPPPPFRQSAPYLLELRQGGGLLALFGLPFFLSGLAMTLTVLGVLHMKVDSPNRWTPLIMAAMGLVFTAVGAVLVLGRQWLTIDLSRGLAIRQQGLLVPMRSRDWQLGDFNAVVISYNAGDSDSPERYPVRLRSRIGNDLALSKGSTFGNSRALAEYLSGFLRLPLVDTTTDREVTLAPEHAGDTLGARLLHESATASAVERPLTLRSQIEESGGQVRVVIPGGGSWFKGVLSIIFPLIVLLVFMPVLLRFFTRTRTPAHVQYGFVLFMVAFLLLPLIISSVNLMVASKRNRTVVTASPAGLKIERRAAWRTDTTEIPSADLLDLDCSTLEGAIKVVRSSPAQAAQQLSPGTERILRLITKYVPSRGIIVKSRTGITCIGEGLPGEELLYLVGVLRRALQGPQVFGLSTRAD